MANHVEAYSQRGLVTEALYGIRFFVALDIGPLRSLSNLANWWPKPAQTATCQRRNMGLYRLSDNDLSWGDCQGFLTKDCTCGIYALTDMDNDDFRAYGALPSRVAAVIKGYGKSVVGENGFRVEHAEVVALSTNSVVQTLLPHTAWSWQFRDVDPTDPTPYAEEWGVPSFSSVENMLAEYPLSDTTSLTEKESAA